MLYTQSLESITWQTIEEFCEQKISENSYLDYKEEFPNNLEKTIAAMANTLGGIILIGIEEDENKPKLPIEGVPFERGLSERVTNIILSNITPPVFPDIQVCPNSDKKKAIVLIRIHQSHQTPHAIANNTKVYLRTANRNKPEERAKINDIFWLAEHRQKAVSLREQLYKESENNFKKRYAKLTIKNIFDNWFTLSICPLYPREPFLVPPEISKIINDIKVNNYYGNWSEFPFWGDQIRGRISPNGTIILFQTDHHIYFIELNCFGLLSYKQNLFFQEDPNHKHEDDYIPTDIIYARLDEFYDSSVKFYDRIGYQGPLDFRMHFENGSHRRIIGPYNKLLLTLEDEIKYNSVVMKKSLEDPIDKFDLVYSTMQRIAWSYGWDIQKNEISSFFDRHKPE